MDEKKKMREDETFFFHGYTNDESTCDRKFHRFTIAGRYRDVKDGRCLRLGISICEPNDQFNKKDGRERAIQRLNNPYGLGNVELCMRIPKGQELRYFNMFADNYQGLKSREIQTIFGFEEMKVTKTPVSEVSAS